MILDRYPNDDFADVRERTRGLRAIGYWRTKRFPHLPDPHDFVDPSWDEHERAKVAAYLRSALFLIQWRGYSWCRFGCTFQDADLNIIGSACLSDDIFVWPEGLAHYVELHAIRLPDEFVQHVLRSSMAHR